MEPSFDIRLIPEDAMESILPLADKLNKGKIPYTILQQRLKDMIAMGGYQCIGIYDADELIGICGIWVLNKLYAGKHIEPDNVYIEEPYRNKGVGKLMMDWMFDYAKSIGCIGSEINCYVENKKAHKFYERHGYEPLAYHFFKKFD